MKVGRLPIYYSLKRAHILLRTNDVTGTAAYHWLTYQRLWGDGRLPLAGLKKARSRSTGVGWDFALCGGVCGLLKWEVYLLRAKRSFSGINFLFVFASCLLYDARISCTSPYSSEGWNSTVLKIKFVFRFSFFSFLWEILYSKMVDRLGTYL